MGKLRQPTESRLGLVSKVRNIWFSDTLTKSRGFRKLIFGAAPIFIMAFIAAFAAASIFTPTQISDAATSGSNQTVVSANLNATSYYIKIWSDSEVNLDLLANASGPMSVQRSAVKTFTNSPSGYKLYLAMATTNTALNLEENVNVIPSVGVSQANATALPVNTWGFAIDGTSTGTSSPWSGTHTTGNSMAANNEIFAGVPAYGSEVNGLVQTTSTANGAGGTDAEDYAAATELGVYYGVRANADMPSGKYSNTVSYTAIAEGTTSGDFAILSTSPSSYVRPKRFESMGMSLGQSTGTQLTINTSVFTNMTDLGTATVTLKGGPLSTDYTSSAEQQTYTCANPELSTIADLVSVTCDLPLAYAGKYDLTVTLNKFGLTQTTTYYYYVNWSTISAMQEMGYYNGSTESNKISVCDYAQAPESTMYLPVTGKRSDGLNTLTTATPWTPSTSTTANSVPEIYLKDLRDYTFTAQAGSRTGGGHVNGQTGYYRIRKLADGNCWMTENMDHPQQTGHYYFNWDTDLHSKTSWAPSANFIDGSVANTTFNTYNSSTGTYTCIQAGCQDTQIANDHTYYGMGCSNGWGTDGLGGSMASCTTRDVTTADSETQVNGTYYNFQAATVGTGGTMSTQYSNSEDTFCPAGWQLPYSGNATTTTDKSWARLFSLYGYTDSSAGSTSARTYPLSYVYSGNYHWSNGRLYYQGANGLWWSPTISSSTNSYRLGMYSSRLIPANSINKLYGFTLRCVSRN